MMKKKKMIATILTMSTIIATPAVYQNVFAEESYSYGSCGQEIAEIQHKLNLVLGTDLIEEDGIWGSRTEKAVRDFQDRFGFRVNGIAEQQFMNKLTDLYNLQISRIKFGSLKIGENSASITFSGKGIDSLSYQFDGTGTIKASVDWKPAYSDCTIYLEFEPGTSGNLTVNLNNVNYTAFASKTFHIGDVDLKVDLKNAVAYAVDHAFDPPTFENQDCANFISRALRESGVEIYTASCREQRDQLQNLGWTVSYRSPKYSDLQVGSVIYMKGSDGDGDRYGHVGLVTKLDNGNVYFSAHTNPRQNSPISLSTITAFANP